MPSVWARGLVGLHRACAQGQEAASGLESLQGSPLRTALWLQVNSKARLGGAQVRKEGVGRSEDRPSSGRSSPGLSGSYSRTSSKQKASGLPRIPEGPAENYRSELHLLGTC